VDYVLIFEFRKCNIRDGNASYSSEGGLRRGRSVIRQARAAKIASLARLRHPIVLGGYPVVIQKLFPNHIYIGTIVFILWAGLGYKLQTCIHRATASSQCRYLPAAQDCETLPNIFAAPGAPGIQHVRQAHSVCICESSLLLQVQKHIFFLVRILTVFFHQYCHHQYGQGANMKSYPTPTNAPPGQRRMLTTHLHNSVQAEGQFLLGPECGISAEHARYRNADKNAKSLAPLFEVVVSASKSLPNLRLPSSPRVCALVAVFALKNAPLEPSTSSICLPTSSPMSRIDTPPTASSFIDCLPLDLDKFWVWLAPTELERALPSKY
jgi:hypothetical protein